MGLITRQGKGSKLTIEELDGNLTYLEGLVSLYKKTVSSNIDWSEASMQEIEINENTNFTFTGATTGQTLSLILDAKKNALITWPESIQWTTDINELDLNYTISYADVGTGFNNTFYSIAIQADGKILVGGQFTSYNGVEANNIIRLNSDGSVDTSFIIGTGFNSTVNTIAIQGYDGKILVGGQFTSYNGVAANRVIRLNSDGSVDTSFFIGTGFNGDVYSIAIQDDGKILVGGQFTSYNGVEANYIIRLNSDGSRDESFVIGAGFSSAVYSIAIQDDGKILVGGNFTSYNGVSANRLIRLNSDGSVDTSFVIGAGFNSTVYSIAIQDYGGEILVGGNFTTYNGVSAKYIIRLNSDGSVDTSFGIGTGFNSTVYSIAIQYYGGEILVGGNFTTYNGVSANYIIRLNSDGSRDESFGTGFSNTVYSIAIQGYVMILVGGLSANRIIRLNSDGSRDTSFVIGVGFNGDVYSIAIQADGKILIGGGFTSYNGVSANRIIRLNSDGSRDTSFVIGTGFNSTVSIIAIQADGKILVGGQFISYNGVAANRIIRLNSDGSRDTSFVIGTGFNTTVVTITTQDDGKILIGGYFTSYNGVSANRVIRLNTDGSRDTSFVIGAGFNGDVLSIAIQDDGKILVGGNFTSYNGVEANYIIRLNSDGSRDTSFVIGAGFSSAVYSIAIQDDGKILVGGNFTSYNGVEANRLIRLNSDGSRDTSFVIGTGFNGDVYSIAIQDDGKILVGGRFTTYNGVSANRIIRLKSNGSRDTSFDTKFDINLTNTLYVIKTKLNNIYLGFLFQNSDNYSIIISTINYEQAYEICNFYYNGTYYIGESTI